MGLFSWRKAAPLPIAIIHLNARLQPLHRGEFYEDPLNELLAQQAPGSRVVGGGTEFTPETGPLSADIELELGGDPHEALRCAIDCLEELGAPVGSWAQLGDEPQRAFGVTHGLVLRLDREGLPEAVYDQNDINDLIAAMLTALGRDGRMQSWWQSEQTSDLYFYGREPVAMRATIKRVIDRHPLAENAVMEAIT